MESLPRVGGHLTLVRPGVVHSGVQDVQSPQLRSGGNGAVSAAETFLYFHPHTSRRQGLSVHLTRCIGYCIPSTSPQIFERDGRTREAIFSGQQIIGGRIFITILLL